MTNQISTWPCSCNYQLSKDFEIVCEMYFFSELIVSCAALFFIYIKHQQQTIERVSFRTASFIYIILHHPVTFVYHFLCLNIT